MADEVKFTPGPWKAEEFYGRTTRLRVRTADNTATICQVTALVHKQANARLIAAAPDMLTALKAMLRHSCVADSAPEDKDPEDHDAERMARAALAKAAQAATPPGPQDPPRHGKRRMVA